MWSGSGNLEFSEGQNFGTIEPAKKRLALRLYYDVPSDLLSDKIYCSDGTLCAEGGISIGWKVGDDGFQDGVDAVAGPVIYIALDDGWNGVAGQRAYAPSSRDEPAMTLEWGRLQVSNPPAPVAAR